MNIKISLLTSIGLCLIFGINSSCQAMFPELLKRGRHIARPHGKPKIKARLRMYSSSSVAENVKKPAITKVHIENLNYSIKGKQIFDELDLSVVPKDKITIVGENGVGKSTLLRIINGEKLRYGGKVELQGVIGYLPQSLENLEDKPALEHIVEHTKREDWQELAEDINSVPFDTWLQEFNSRGGHSIFKVLAQMKLPPQIVKQDLFTLSGGEKTKIHLCALYHQNPDILLLDEPTNHLDVEGIGWLERYLRSFDGGVVMITHDRTLINRTSNRISELSPITHKLTHFRGSYDVYLKEQEKILARAKAERERQENEMKGLESRLTVAKEVAETSKGRARSDGDKLSYNARGQRQQKDRGRLNNQLTNKIETIKESLTEVPEARHKLDLSFINGVISDNLTVEAENLSKTLGGITLFENLNFNLKNKSRLVVRGPNGVGKTTLLRILAKDLNLDRGNINYSKGIRIGFLDQEQESVDLDLNAVEFIQESAPKFPHTKILNLLKRFGLYHRHDLEAPFADLSIGCRRKAQLAGMVAAGANLLLLDEPTNHMDIMSLEQIERELLDFPGIVIAVTHDRYFSDKIATQVLELKKNNIDKL